MGFDTYDLVILDYSDSSVHIYHVKKDIEPDDDLIIALGYELSNVEWICGNLEIVKHRRMIKEIDKETEE